MLALADNVHVHITFVQRNVRVQMLEKAVEACAEVLLALIDKGSRPTIEWNYRDAFVERNPWSQQDSRVHPENFYTETKVAWKEDFVPELRRVRVWLQWSSPTDGSAESEINEIRACHIRDPLDRRFRSSEMGTRRGRRQRA